jgi:hypothetical protein
MQFYENCKRLPWRELIRRGAEAESSEPVGCGVLPETIKSL